MFISLCIPRLDAESDPIQFQLLVDIAESDVPCLISRKSMANLNSLVDFATNIATVCKGVQIQLIASGSGRIQLPDYPPHDRPLPSKDDPKVYPLTAESREGPIADAELMRIHLNLGHCSDFALRNIPKSSHKAVPEKWSPIYSDDALSMGM